MVRLDLLNQKNQNDGSNKSWSLAECVETHASTPIKKLERRKIVGVLESKLNKRWELPCSWKSGCSPVVPIAFYTQIVFIFPQLPQDILAIASSAQHVFRLWCCSNRSMDYDSLPQISSSKGKLRRRHHCRDLQPVFMFLFMISNTEVILKRLVKWLH